MCRGWSQHQHPPSPTCCPAQPSWQIHHWAINSLDRKSETAKGSLKLWTSIMNAAMVSFASVSMAWVMQWQTISKPRKCTQQKQAQQLDALLLSPGLSWGRQPHLKTKVVPSKVKGKDWRLRQYSSMDKSWGQRHLPHCPWSWMERCRLPWSRHRCPSGCLECRCNIKHQLTLETSYPVMETHANSTPVQLYATCMCLPKRKAKKHGHCRKNLRRLLTTIWQRKAVWKTSFSNKPSGTINPVYLPQTTPEAYKECVNQQNTVYHNSCPIFLSCNLGWTFH